MVVSSVALWLGAQPYLMAGRRLVVGSDDVMAKFTLHWFMLNPHPKRNTSGKYFMSVCIICVICSIM